MLILQGRVQHLMEAKNPSSARQFERWIRKKEVLERGLEVRAAVET
jgi:hypothetical protein